MALWGGRFTEKPNEEAFNFNESFSFDKRFFKEDILGSVAHAKMLAKQKIISKKEAKELVKHLNQIEKDIIDGKIILEKQIGKFEDIHSFIEAELTKRAKDIGKKIHTARSRNDQVALDMRLYIRNRIDDTIKNLASLNRTIENIIQNNKKTFVPGFTHMQKAQPTTIARHYSCFLEMFSRDITRLYDCRVRMNECPLGAGAFNGTTFNIDREYTAQLLGFDKATDSEEDSVSDRDYLIEYLSCLSIIQMHLSRIAEEIIIWNSNDYKYIEVKDEYATGSSMMPQKKNPDMAELIRGKTGRVYGSLMSILTVMKALPFSYDKDMQEDKELAFDSIYTVNNCIKIMTAMLKTISFNKEKMKMSCEDGFTNATDLADYLVKKGVPFREAHEIVGKIVLWCEKNNCSLTQIPIDEYKKFSNKIEKDVYKEISIENCVNKREKRG